MDLDEVVKRIVATMRVREEAEGKEFGVVVIAEGLAEYLPHEAHRRRAPRRARTHRRRPSSTSAGSSPTWWARSTPSRPARSGRSPACSSATSAAAARPQAFDVMLGSQLGVGAYRALVEKRLDGVMVSVSGQLELELRAVQPVGRSGHAGDGGSLHRAGQRLPPPGPLPGNLCRLRSDIGCCLAVGMAVGLCWGGSCTATPSWMRQCNCRTNE